MLAVEGCIIDILFDFISGINDFFCHGITLEDERHLSSVVNLLSW
jgi:hypothetical protein